MPEQTTKAHCNKCQRETAHDVLHGEKTTWEERYDEYSSIDGGDLYELLRCRGCANITLRHQSWFSEDEGVKTTYYPPAIARHPPKWLHDIKQPLDFNDSPIEELLTEIYTALQNNSRRLAAMGVRALLEHIMIDKVGDRGTFRGNIQAFHDAGYLSPKTREYLEAILEVGHAAIHRGFKPSHDELSTLLDITENLLETIYVHERGARKLGKSVAPRGPRPAEGGDA